MARLRLWNGCRSRHRHDVRRLAMVIAVVLLVIVVGGIIIAIFGWDRYRDGRSSSGGGSAAQATDEVFIDPDSGQRMRVWFDPSTGQREYRPE